MAVDINDVTVGLVGDLQLLRSGKITNADARTRAQLAREILRAVHLSLQGIKMIEGNAEHVTLAIKGK